MDTQGVHNFNSRQPSVSDRDSTLCGTTASSASAEANQYAVRVSVVGVNFRYHFTEADLMSVFGRFGRIRHIDVAALGVGVGLVYFDTKESAICAAEQLNDKELMGLAGRLSVQLMSKSCTRKHACRFEIGIENEPDFAVSLKIIGPNGFHMKQIVMMTGAKLRLRGIGSGYREGSDNAECNEPLHLCVSSPSKAHFDLAVSMVSRHLECVYDEYRAHCLAHGRLARSDLGVQIRPHPLAATKQGQEKSVGSSQAPLNGKVGSAAVGPVSGERS